MKLKKILLLFVPGGVGVSYVYPFLPVMMTCAAVATSAVVHNFPDAVPSLLKHPLYMDDLTTDLPCVSTDVTLCPNRKKYYNACRKACNVLAVVMVTSFVEYGHAVWMTNTPTSPAEIVGVVGGMCALLSRAQSTTNRALLKMYHLSKKRRDSDSSTTGNSILLFADEVMLKDSTVVQV